MKKAAFVLLLASASVHAEFLTANDWLSRHNDSDYGKKMMALGYVAGVFDALHNATFCPPSNVTLGQVTEMAKQLMEANPSSRHLSADAFIAKALKDAWPCKKTTGV